MPFALVPRSASAVFHAGLELCIRSVPSRVHTLTKRRKRHRRRAVPPGADTKVSNEGMGCAANPSASLLSVILIMGAQLRKNALQHDAMPSRLTSARTMATAPASEAARVLALCGGGMFGDGMDCVTTPSPGLSSAFIVAGDWPCQDDRPIRILAFDWHIAVATTAASAAEDPCQTWGWNVS